MFVLLVKLKRKPYGLNSASVNKPFLLLLFFLFLFLLLL